MKTRRLGPPFSSYTSSGPTHLVGWNDVFTWLLCSGFRAHLPGYLTSQQSAWVYREHGGTFFLLERPILTALQLGLGRTHLLRHHREHDHAH